MPPRIADGFAVWFASTLAPVIGYIYSLAASPDAASTAGAGAVDGKVTMQVVFVVPVDVYKTEMVNITMLPILDMTYF